jgi:hypothetical protein
MSNQPSSGDHERIEKLALGLLMRPNDPWEVQPRLFVGKIPENLPLELPVPEQTEVLGTLARNASTVDIVLESTLTAKEIQSFYRTRLTALGWQEPDEDLPYHPGGFVRHPGPPPQMPDSFLRHTITFCHDASGAGLAITVFPQEDHTTRVRLELALERYRNRCAELARIRQQAQGMMPKLIPYLFPPPGAQQHSRSSGGGWREVDRAAVLTTTLGLQDVAEHYGEQLHRAGWTQTGQGVSGPLAWQTWHCISDEQQLWKRRDETGNALEGGHVAPKS